MITNETKYGKLTLIEYFYKNNRKFGKFQCECGVTKSMRLDYVLKATDPTCGCGKRRIPDLGEKFNRLTFIKYSGLGCPKKDSRRTNGQRLSSMGEFKCDCGKSKTYAISYVVNGTIKGCGCLRTLEDGESAKNRLIRQYKNTAKYRKLEYSLTKDEFSKLTKGNCHYCGIAPMQVCKSNSITGDYTYNGIDRVDNYVGYVLSNCVPCCSWCNHAKATGNSTDFIKHCEAVVSFQKSRLTSCQQ